MLYANDLGLEVIVPTNPWSGAARALRGLGAYDEGVCRDGADFVCGVVGGVDSCRPCNTPQLAAFKNFQNQLNRLVVAIGLSSKYRLVDNRNSTPMNVRLVIEAAIANAKHQDTYRAMAIYVPELIAYLTPMADRLGVPQNVPAPPSAPSDGGNGPIPVPGDGTPPIVTSPVEPGTGLRRPGLAPMLAMVGGVAALGLTVYGIKRYRERHG